MVEWRAEVEDEVWWLVTFLAVLKESFLLPLGEDVVSSVLLDDKSAASANTPVKLKNLKNY